jgi:hypothetical protein
MQQHDLHLTVERGNLILETGSCFGASTFEFILHRLEISHEIGEMCAFPAKSGVLFDEAPFDTLYRQVSGRSRFSAIQLVPSILGAQP